MDVDRHMDTDVSITGTTWWHTESEVVGDDGGGGGGGGGEDGGGSGAEKETRKKQTTRERVVLLGHHCNDIVHILSDRDLLVALVENEAEWLDGCRYSTLKELGYAMISTSPLECVPITMTVLDAFRHVLRRKRSVAVVTPRIDKRSVEEGKKSNKEEESGSGSGGGGSGGKLVGVLSPHHFVSYLATTGTEELDFNYLLRPLAECSLLDERENGVLPVCHENDTLASVVDAMCRSEMNRELIVVDEEDVPISMMSPCDLFSLVVRIHERSGKYVFWF